MEAQQLLRRIFYVNRHWSLIVEASFLLKGPFSTRRLTSEAADTRHPCRRGERRLWQPQKPQDASRRGLLRPAPTRLLLQPFCIYLACIGEIGRQRTRLDASELGILAGQWHMLWRDHDENKRENMALVMSLHGSEFRIGFPVYMRNFSGQLLWYRFRESMHHPASSPPRVRDSGSRRHTKKARPKALTRFHRTMHTRASFRLRGVA